MRAETVKMPGPYGMFGIKYMSINYLLVGLGDGSDGKVLAFWHGDLSAISRTHEKVGHGASCLRS